MTTPTIQRSYTRTDPRGHFPHPAGRGNLAANRLVPFWRPLIDITDSAHAPTRLRAIPLVSSWLADPGRPVRRSWFSMIGVPGQRRQVLHHAGLAAYDCTDPKALPADLRTPGWNTLTGLIENFRDLDTSTRALLAFHLAQLSYCHLATRLTGLVHPTGEADTDHYAHEVARVHARIPGRTAEAVAVFEELAAVSGDPRMVLAACFQGIGHSLGIGHHLSQSRGARDGLAAARAFHTRAQPVLRSPARDWHDHLLRTRYFRAEALLHLTEGDQAAMKHSRDIALDHHHALGTGENTAGDLLVRENLRYLLELSIRLSRAAQDPPAVVRQLCAQLNTLDPNCVEARLVVGDGHAAIQDWTQAAHWYQKAGELGTGAGAIGWFRAAQCHDLAGDPAAALNAMGHCLELDTTAVEPRTSLSAAAGHAA